MRSSTVWLHFFCAQFDFNLFERLRPIQPLKFATIFFAIFHNPSTTLFQPFTTLSVLRQPFLPFQPLRRGGFDKYSFTNILQIQQNSFIIEKLKITETCNGKNIHYYECVFGYYYSRKKNATFLILLVWDNSQKGYFFELFFRSY